MVKRADAGDIVDQEPVPIGQDDTSLTVFGNVTVAASRILERRIEDLLTGKAPRRPQDASQASYFGGRKPDDGLIRWPRAP
jgi:methionyl-tRNA formyltransferase